MVGRPGKRDRLYGLDERIAEYRDLTNASFQHEIDIGTLLVSENLSVDVASKWPSDPPCSSDYHKASRRLGLLFAPFDVPTVYRMIGVKRL
ncbi:MAG: hypothetical protein HY808_12825 [Nitrospirae bacterium]|nr:hypothetical protein [Nitrospirota bacterium]